MLQRCHTGERETARKCGQLTPKLAPLKTKVVEFVEIVENDEFVELVTVLQIDERNDDEDHAITTMIMVMVMIKVDETYE